MAEEWTISEQEVEHRRGVAEGFVKGAYEKRPDAETWGLFSYGDASGGIGGGIGAFLWFEGREGLLEFAGQHLTFLLPGLASIDPGRVSRESKASAASISAGEMDLEAGRRHLNSVLRHFSQISWWGQLEELFAGDAEFARELRSGFREWRDRGEADEQLDESEEEAFRLFLREYGA